MTENKWNLNIGLSPCPNDTFIFHALLHGLIQLPGFRGLRLVPHMADVEQLNARALKGEYEITKLSLGVIPELADKYTLLGSGAALGWGCGPLLVASRPMTEREMRSASIAIPGRFTTANLLLDLHGAFEGARREMLFSDIMGAVQRHEVEMGLIIHEGRFTYADRGLVKVLDMGEWWEQSFSLPLPLGAIAIRRDMAANLAFALEDAIAASLDYAWRNPDASGEFVRAHAQELDSAVTSAHIKTFVTEYSADLGEIGRNAIKMLIGEARKKRGQKAPANLFL